MEHLARPAADRVDHDVDPAELLERLGDHPIAVGLDGHVGRDGEALRPGRPHPSQRVIAQATRPVGDRHARPGAGEGLGHRRPDRSAAAGHDGDAPLEVEDVELTHDPPHRGEGLAPRDSGDRPADVSSIIDENSRRGPRRQRGAAARGRGRATRVTG